MHQSNAPIDAPIDVADDPISVYEPRTEVIRLGPGALVVIETDGSCEQVDSVDVSREAPSRRNAEIPMRRIGT
ncbi:hypothetical protein N5079_28950 [Planotetraspora sp. A-T 1434]|uniref:hypothetical protein n=1 Tax=Planotetraspora sp. A-T 1434 TaxID=2979219 RepID=UPI0021C21A09|nr:hypothetical protein [Planotetraspora sp. A-T 1434]MCT9934237.1 hypothetical protein [Planotetraspora sp. A-T 1434]